MKMKQYYTVEKFSNTEYDMILGPVSQADAWACMRRFQEENPFRNFEMASRLVEVEIED